MHPIIRTTAQVMLTGGGIAVGGSVLSIPMAPLLAVAGITAGTIVTVEMIRGRRRNNKTRHIKRR